MTDRITQLEKKIKNLAFPKNNSKNIAEKKRNYKYLINVYEGQYGIKMSEPEKEDLWNDLHFNKKTNQWTNE